MIVKTARVIRSTANGVAYINVTPSNEVAAFSFDKIKGYRGETASELGLKTGKLITVEYNDDSQKIESVIIPAA
ncbi:MAG: hypothetical protein PHE55_11915 [Methylococcaceae bacterium]|nr:hypothetical protein [Methylococcaceae bacterium]